MNKEIEEEFVKKFVIVEKRERVMYELKSAKKRDHIIQYLANYIEKKYAILSDSNIDRILKESKKFLDPLTEVYVIGDSIYDGRTVTFAKAFEDMSDSGGNCFIICRECNTVFVRGEYIFGKAEPIYVLHR